MNKLKRVLFFVTIFILTQLIIMPTTAFASASVQYYSSEEEFRSNTNIQQGSSGKSINGSVTIENSNLYDDIVSENYSDSLTSGDYTDSISRENYTDIINSENYIDVVAPYVGDPVVSPYSLEPLYDGIEANMYRNKRREQKPINVVINGEKRDVDYGISPLMIEGRIFVPLEFITRNLGYATSYYEEEMYADIDNGKLIAEIGTYTMERADGFKIPSDAPPFLYQGMMMVSLRQVGHGLNYDVSWNAKTWTVSLDRRKPHNLFPSNIFDTSK